MKLRLTDDKSLFLPSSAITQTTAILAMRGAGKSNLAAVMAEEMWSAELPFVVIDPVGAWWGLRSSADGKEAGLPITIFGGRHGDVPLEKTGGQLVADIVVDQRLSCVLDVSEFSEGSKIQFLIDFAERLYRKNTDPLHLFLEEADDYVPQKPFREQARLLRAWENIVRRGRARGLGMTMITQRSAAINKNVLTQIETLFVLRTTSPQDRKAIEGWVDYHGQSKEIIDTLPGLEAGEAWVWSPSWLKICKLVQIRRRVTFDSGATPKSVKGHRPPATLADVDLDKLKEQMADTIERTQAEDPTALRREVAKLRSELRKSEEEVKTYSDSTEHWRKLAEKNAKTTKLTAKPALSNANVNQLERAIAALQKANAFNKTGQSLMVGIQKNLEKALNPLVTIHDPEIRGVPVREELRPVRDPQGARKSLGLEPPVPAEGLTGPEQRILDALAWMESIGVSEPEQTAVAFLAGYTATGGAYLNPRGRLRQAGLIEYRAGNRLSLTLEGRGKAKQPDATLTTAELHQRVLERLPGPEQKILQVLLGAYPDSLPNEVVANKAGYAVGGGAYLNPRGRLRSLGLIEYRAGMVTARDILFLK